MKLLCKLFGHKWIFPVDIYGTIVCERCGIEIYKYNESEPDTYVKWLDKHMD